LKSVASLAKTKKRVSYSSYQNTGFVIPQAKENQQISDFHERFAHAEILLVSIATVIFVGVFNVHNH